MERLHLVSNQLATHYKKFVDSSIDYYRFHDLLTPEEVLFAKKMRDLCEKEIKPILADSYEKATLPEGIIPIFAKAKLASMCLSKPHGEVKPFTFMMLALIELARVDQSIAISFIAHRCLATQTIEVLGSGEQKNRFLPELGSYRKRAGWALTEPHLGSDASSLKTTAEKILGGFKINGTKRWITNADGDYIVCWARETESDEIQPFVIDAKSPGIHLEKITHKLSVRSLQNFQITFKEVFVPENNKLVYGNNFSSTKEILAYSRVLVCAVAVGAAVGVYDFSLRYLLKRNRTHFQLIQEKLVRMMEIIQALLLMTWRITKLYEQKEASIGMIGMAKAWTTKKAREVTSIGRELLGADGLLLENYVMKQFLDIETAYSSDGSFDINTLIAGRELTKTDAFKA